MKYFGYLIAAIATMFITAWLFNHVNAWVGIGFFLAIAALTIKSINNKINNQ